MIVAERKPMEDIKQLIAGKQKLLVLGCGGCVTVCLTGGEKQVELLGSQLRMGAKSDGSEVEIIEKTVTRQCDREFLEEIKDEVGAADAVLSMACGAGVQLLADIYPGARVLPAMNTTFMGANTAPGIWTENCRGCGECRLAETAGVCPIARCSKSLVNGACGGTNKGKCEVSDDIDCAWFLIYERLKELGRLEELKTMREAVDWSKTSSGVQRRLVHEELVEEPEEAPAEEAAEKKA
ncbi:MAG: methylenetetrahydrofolate reductase C-terminal domain-containing protein [Planctomycetota bacterium]|jgi:NAD-dependent dihydropyrimidine dehydrogenase PreA subunit